jgi:excisionase family DNA binding protein
MSKFLTIAEVAERLNISEKTLRKWVGDGILPGFKLGGCVRVDEGDLAAFIESGRTHKPGLATKQTAAVAAGPTAYRYFPPKKSSS